MHRYQRYYLPASFIDSFFLACIYTLKISKKISKTLEATQFNGSVIVPVAAAKPSEVTYN